jgi:hypothetical protein
MARLPQPGADAGNWGNILNDYLSQVHNNDGTLKNDVVTTGTVADGAISEILLSSAVQTKLNAPATIADGSITKVKLESSVQTSLNKADSALQTAPVTSVNTRTGAITLTNTDVGLGSVDNTADSAKPVSTAQQTALNLKAPLASPTFTGTVSGITKSMVGLSNVDDTADLAKPVSTATQTALNAKQSRGLPSHVPTTSVGMYQPDRALYNVKPSNTRRLRAGLGRAGRSDNAAAAGNYNELWIGDSIVGGCTGLGQGAGGSDRFDRINSVAQFSGRALAAKSGISHVGTGLTRIHDGTRFDDRFTLNATATAANTASAATVALTPGGTVTFISNKVGDQVRVTYYDNFGSGTTGFTISVNGASSGAGYRAVTGSSASLWKSVLLTVAVAVGDTVVLTGNTGTVIIGFVQVASSSGGIVTHNLSASGTNSISWANIAGGGGYNNLRVAHESGMLPFEYDVVHCGFGLYDATANPTSTAAYKTAMTTIRNYFPNCDFVIHAMPVPGLYRDDPNTWLQYVTAGFELADSLDVPLVDVQGLLGGYYAEQALGLTTDTTAHLNETAYQMWGEATACLVL